MAVSPTIDEREKPSTRRKDPPLGGSPAGDAPALLGTLVGKEVHDLILTLRFTVGTVIAIILAVLAGYIGSLDYNARLDSYQTKIKLNRQALTETTVYSNLWPTVVRPPEPLSILNHGLEGRVGTDFQVSVDTENTEASGENRGNEYLSVFSEVDLTVVVAVILGLLALLFTFDAVCGEREAGTLKLMMTYRLARWQVLLGKFFGAWITLMIPTALACLVSVFVMGLVAHVHFGAPEILRIGLIFLLYALYLSLMLLIGLVVSSFFERSSIALVFATFIWFLFVTIVPNLATMIPDFVGNRASVYQTAQEGLRQTHKDQDALLKDMKDPRQGFSFYYAINNSWRGFTAFECHLGDHKFYNQLTDYFSKLVPISLKLAGRRADIWRQYIRYRYHQAAVARGLSFFSPTAVFHNLANYLSGTSEADYRHFVDLAGQYRRTFLDYLQRKNAFNSWRWFTSDPPDQDWSWTVLLTGKSADELTASGANPADVINKIAHGPDFWKKLQQFEKDHMTGPGLRLPLGDLPAFTYQRTATGVALVRAAPELLYLLVLNIVLFLVAYVRFVRYDVR